MRFAWGSSRCRNGCFCGPYDLKTKTYSEAWVVRGGQVFGLPGRPGKTDTFFPPERGGRCATFSHTGNAVFLKVMPVLGNSAAVCSFDTLADRGFAPNAVQQAGDLYAKDRFLYDIGVPSYTRTIHQRIECCCCKYPNRENPEAVAFTDTSYSIFFGGEIRLQTESNKQYCYGCDKANPETCNETRG